MRLPRVFPALALAAAMATPLIPATALLAQDKPTPDKPAAPAPDKPAAPAPDKPAAPAPDKPVAPAPDKPAAPAPDKPAAPAPAAPAAPANPDAPPALTPRPAANPVTEAAENFWHYAKIAKYDLAVPEGQKLLDPGVQPADMLRAFQDAAADRKDNLYDTMFK